MSVDTLLDVLLRQHGHGVVGGVIKAKAYFSFKIILFWGEKNNEVFVFQAEKGIRDFFLVGKEDTT